MDKKETIKRALHAAFPNTIPVLTGFLVLGSAYGVLMLKSGYGTLWSVMMSALAFCGSMQFVAITLLTTVFNPIQAFLLSIMVNARHLFYGLAMLEKYKGLGKARGLLIYTLCDETFSISSSIKLPEDVDKKYFYLSISLLNYLYWVLGTFIGSILGRFITFNTKGLDFVLTALFVVLFIEQLKKKENRISGIIGVASAAVALLVFGAGNMVIPSMIIILLILMAGREKNMLLTPLQTLLMVLAIALGSVLTRFTPFFLFPQKKDPPKLITYLGRTLPPAMMGLLVVYCLEGVSITTAPHGIPELIAILVIIAVHMWKNNVLVSIGGGTIVYMVLVQSVFS